KITASPVDHQLVSNSVTFTATITPTSGSQYPSGTVAFYDGLTQIGTTQTVTQVGATNVGTASITLSNLSGGNHADITAQYTPTAGNGLLPSGPSMNVVVGDPTDNPISYAITSNAFQANTDNYIAGAGTTLTVNAANGILTNDTGGPLTIVSPSTATIPQNS